MRRSTWRPSRNCRTPAEPRFGQARSPVRGRSEAEWLDRAADRGQSRVVMAAVHATFAHVSELARRTRRAGGREAGGGGRRPPQFRIQSECALTFKNASSGQNLSAVRPAHVNGGAHAVELCGALDRCRVQARSLRTNVTCVWGVSDPLQLDHGAKKGGWQRGSPSRPVGRRQGR